MFKRIRIQLRGPICNCTEEDLRWDICRDSESYAKLVLSCALCKTKLIVPQKKFVACFDLEHPYPSKKKTKPKRKKTPDGEVIQLFPNKKKD